MPGFEKDNAFILVYDPNSKLAMELTKQGWKTASESDAMESEYLAVPELSQIDIFFQNDAIKENQEALLDEFYGLVGGGETPQGAPARAGVSQANASTAVPDTEAEAKKSTKK